MNNILVSELQGTKQGLNYVTRFSMTAPLKRVLVAHAKDAFKSQSNLAANWERYGYHYEPDFNEACRESDDLASILSRAGADVEFLPSRFCKGLDALYVHDPIVTLPSGFGLCRMGKDLRQDEPNGIAEWLHSQGLEIKGKVEGEAKLEGGDVVWLEPDLVAIGEGYRSNKAGIDKLREMSGFDEDQVISVPLPHWNGPADVLHLMSFISPVREKTLLVYSRLMPVIIRNMLLDRGFELLEVPDEEYDSMGCNVLSLGSGRCLIEQKNQQTADVLRSAGLDVQTYKGDHISRPGEGGPTCLTRPLLRG